MKWTREQPTVEGHYWARSEVEGVVSAHIVEVLGYLNDFSAYHCGNELGFGLNDFTEWAGPIPEPVETTMEGEG